MFWFMIKSIIFFKENLNKMLIKMSLILIKKKKNFELKFLPQQN